MTRKQPICSEFYPIVGRANQPRETYVVKQGATAPGRLERTRVREVLSDLFNPIRWHNSIDINPSQYRTSRFIKSPYFARRISLGETHAAVSQTDTAPSDHSRSVGRIIIDNQHFKGPYRLLGNRVETTPEIALLVVSGYY